MLMMWEHGGRSEGGVEYLPLSQGVRGGLTEEEEKFKLIRGRRRKEENSKTQKKLCVWKVGRQQVWLKPACMEDMAGCECRRRGWG